MRTLLTRWPRSRGLTMIELLTVVALLALIVALVVAFMFPSDDRRVKQEAEKLAAYCEAAGGEAKMSEGAVRVVLTFDDGVYKREQARVGARITDLAWTEDEKMRAERVRAPVKIAAIQVADAGSLESGTGWLVWEDTKTRGGVVVLQLNEAVWSVIVDPANGQVRIERGRAELPNAGKGFKRTFARPELVGLTDGTTVSPDELARALDSIPTSMPPPPPADPARSDAPATGGVEAPPAVPEDPPSIQDPGTPPPLEPPLPPTEPPSAPSMDAGVNSGDAATTPPDPSGDPCENYNCPPQHGMAQMCVVIPGEDSQDTPRCVPDPRGHAYIGRNYRLGGFLAEVPEAKVAEEYIRDLLNVRGYKFHLVFPGEGRRGAKFDPLRFPMHMVQGGRQISGDVFGGVPGLTTASRALAVLDAPEQGGDEEDAMSVWVVWPSTGSTADVQTGAMLRNQQGSFELTLPLTNSAGEPCFWRMTTVINIVAVMLPTSGSNHKLVARLNTCLGGARANVRVATNLTLRQVLESLADPICDSNGDDVPDGWPIQINVDLKPSAFANDPSDFQNASVEPKCNN